MVGMRLIGGYVLYAPKPLLKHNIFYFTADAQIFLLGYRTRFFKYRKNLKRFPKKRRLASAPIICVSVVNNKNGGEL
jgi:hypothetical protein